MKIKLICIGEIRESSLAKLIGQYCKKIGFYWPFSLIALPDVKTSKSTGTDKQKELEGKRILEEIGNGDFVVLFDERGREMTSIQFSQFIERKAVELPWNLIFVTGGPYGFSKEVYDRADTMLSLSKMTFTHEMVRLFIVEQIYRAGTIMRGEPYHHE